MLARGVLCRLAAEVPRTSTHDLPQLARLLQRSLAARNGSSIGALSRGLGASLANSRRSYATTVRAKKPTATVKKAVKKQAAKKPAPKKKAAAKTAGRLKKKPAAKKAAPKKKKAAAKPKTKRAKKELTPEQKEKALIRQLKVLALREPTSTRALPTHAVFVSEAFKDNKKIGLAQASDKFKSLTTAEREHYNHLTSERNAARKAEYNAWVRSYTPEQIRIANNARARLRKLLKGKQKSAPAHTAKIQDDRQYKKGPTSYAMFIKDRYASGDLKGIGVGEAAKLISNEWKSLSAGEKQKYNDAYAAERTSRAGEFQRAYGHAPL
ncbi:hypothetical protein BDV96DRAFT_641193 [Lophiotrema nucula]|uniref:HMG box domain-containing protein n=1 Tax=Lophiotrema nucula TaxID=690887 RepID=A0A6A5ZMQ3_9PLEO|nr:hypothetical protein BDV96DRAFT_641193 [Lophiotrema nucula]